MTSISPVFFHQPLICPYSLFVHIILWQNHRLKREENIRGLIYVTFVEGYLMKMYSTWEPSVSSVMVQSLVIRCSTVNGWFVTALKPMLNLPLRTFDVFSVVLLLINSSVYFYFLFLMTMTVKSRLFLQLCLSCL